MLMSGYSLTDIFKELYEKEAVVLEPISVGSRDSYLVVSVNKEKLQQLNREASKDRPKKPVSPTGESARMKPSFDVFQNRTVRDSGVSAEIESLVSTWKKGNLGFSAKGATFSSANPCPYIYRETCQAHGTSSCPKDHYRLSKHPHTVESLGICPFPDTCVVKELCKFIHLEEDRTALLKPLQPARWVAEASDLAALGPFDVVVINGGDLERVRTLDMDPVQTNLLLLWTSAQHLSESQTLFSTWNFRLRHTLLWVKESIEYRSRESKHLLNYEKEYCLLGTREANTPISEFLRTSLIISDGNAKRPGMLYFLLDACYSGQKLEIYPETLNERAGWVLIGSRNIPPRS